METGILYIYISIQWEQAFRNTSSQLRLEYRYIPVGIQWEKAFRYTGSQCGQPYDRYTGSQWEQAYVHRKPMGTDAMNPVGISALTHSYPMGAVIFTPISKGLHVIIDITIAMLVEIFVYEQ
jgi:hypothetical protein